MYPVHNNSTWSIALGLQCLTTVKSVYWLIQKNLRKTGSSKLQEREACQLEYVNFPLVTFAGYCCLEELQQGMFLNKNW